MLDGRHLYLQEVSILLEVDGFRLGVGTRQLRRHEMDQLRATGSGTSARTTARFPSRPPVNENLWPGD
jgi:hypothetical protein